jgi:hypothetical protein
MNAIIAEKKFIAERTGIPYSNLSQSYLRAETALSNLSQYDFNLQKNNVASPIVTERLLELNDEFVMTHLTIGLKLPATPLTDATHLAAQVFTFPDQNAGFAATEESIYNSSFSLTINRKEFLPEFPVRFFRRVPDQQSGLNATGGATNKNAYPNGLYGFAAFEPVKIDGRQTIQALLSLGAGVTMTANTFLVLECRGYLVTNAKS